jgi:hypothetical protein
VGAQAADVQQGHAKVSPGNNESDSANDGKTEYFLWLLSLLSNQNILVKNIIPPGGPGRRSGGNARGKIFADICDRDNLLDTPVVLLSGTKIGNCAIEM